MPVYKDTAANRKLGRVGKAFGKEVGGCKDGKTKDKGGCKVGNKTYPYVKKGKATAKPAKKPTQATKVEPKPKRVPLKAKVMPRKHPAASEAAEKAKVRNRARIQKEADAIAAKKAPKSAPKSAPKTMGGKLTGLTAAEMNKMSPAELFGMLPVAMAKKVLDPKTTGVKVAGDIRKQVGVTKQQQQLPLSIKIYVNKGRPTTAPSRHNIFDNIIQEKMNLQETANDIRNRDFDGRGNYQKLEPQERRAKERIIREQIDRLKGYASELVELKKNVEIKTAKLNIVPVPKKKRPKVFWSVDGKEIDIPTYSSSRAAMGYEGYEASGSWASEAEKVESKEWRFADSVVSYIKSATMGGAVGKKRGFIGSKHTVDVLEYDNLIKGISFYLIDIDDKAYDQPDPRSVRYYFAGNSRSSEGGSWEQVNSQANIIIGRYMGEHYHTYEGIRYAVKGWKENPYAITGNYTQNKDYTDFIRFIKKVLKIKF